jgi:peptide/nickel transport system substrate-binding protein
VRTRWLLLAASLAALSGCRGKGVADAGSPFSAEWLEGRLPVETSTPVDGGTLVVRVMSEPGGLNPLDDAYRDGWVSRITHRLVLESLLDVDPKSYALVPALASAFSDSADHHTTTLTLREARFSDGAALTAADVLATLDALMRPGHPTGALRGELAGLAGWTAPDARTVVLTWSAPSFAGLRALARVPIFEASALKGDWNALAHAPIGTGPFVMEKWTRGESLSLARRPGGAAYLERLVFRFVKDHTVAGTLFEQGQFDLMTNLQPVLWRALEAPGHEWARGYHRIRSVDNSFSYIAWNEAHPALADVRVRQALRHLYDAALISKVVDLGLELPTTCPFYRGSDSCDPQASAPAYSVEAARALLADAGFTDEQHTGVLSRDGQPLRFTFLLPANSVRLGKLVPMLQEQLQQVGIDLKIEKVETTTLSARQAKRDFDAISRVWTEFDREEDVSPLFHSSQRDGGANVAGYASAEADALLDGLRTELDVSKRREQERALHRVLVKDQPWLIMTARQSLDAAKLRVHGLEPSLTWYDLRGVWVDP